MWAVRTPYVLVMQSDMPLKKSLEAQLLPLPRLTKQEPLHEARPLAHASPAQRLTLLREAHRARLFG